MISANYLIIGTGPIGVFTGKYLLEKNKSIVIIDNSEKQSFQKSIKLNLKDSNTKGYVYDFDHTALYKNKDTLPISSKAKGGFTKVWGGTLNRASEKEIEKLGISKEKYLEIYFSILNQIPHIEYDDVYSNFNKNKSKFYEIEKPLLGVGLNNNETWSSDLLLDKLLKKYDTKIEYLNNINVTNISKSGKLFQLHTENKIIEVNVEKIFVCSGSFTSTKIATKMIKGEKFTISDSELSVWPIFKFGKKIRGPEEKREINAFSKDKAIAKLLIKFNKRDTEVKCQLYDLNEESVNTIIERMGLFSVIFKPLINLLKDRLFLVFVYKDSFHSKESLFEISQKKPKIIKIKKQQKKLYVMTFFYNFLKLGFFLIPIKYKFKNYGSFHSGNSIVYKNNIEYQFDDQGVLDNFDNIHFIDSTSIKFIPSGPFTVSSIVNSVNILEKLFNDQ